MSADIAPETVAVPLGRRAYEIRIGPGLLKAAGAHVAPLLSRPRLPVVTEARVAARHLAALESGLATAGIEMRALVLEPGEGAKSWRGLERVVEWLIAEKVGRDELVAAFGGGVIGDLVGFAAAILRRGVRFVQIPTTLLAQVDSSVGGKTGINSAAGKNLVGAFHQPELVLADTALLGTLPARDFLAGYGEVAKYGLLGDAAFFAWLEGHGPRLAAGDDAARVEAVRRSCAMKAAIVARDETELGERALLNLGHTFGHALEAATGYSERLLHGEAVAIGCLLAFRLSEALGLCGAAETARVARHFAAMGLRHTVAEIPGALPDGAGLLTLMEQDKKVRDGRIAFVLVRGVGKAFVARDVDPAAVARVLDEALARRHG